MQFSLKPVFIGWITLLSQIPLQIFLTIWAGGFLGGMFGGLFAAATDGKGEIPISPFVFFAVLVAIVEETLCHQFFTAVFKRDAFAR